MRGKVQGVGCRVQGAGCRSQGAGFRVHGSGAGDEIGGSGPIVRVGGTRSPKPPESGHCQTQCVPEKVSKSKFGRDRS